ncbi:hypothetical protein JKP88DRAFT_350592 [Tribonema minus]|uniref:Uncharacterized protein n=1 Tax=Tribonema minus TaxID=303371 RepID=A0A836C9Z9_9STRA|nr:hypothetical protein JKP88DRAFT_350592 [Tribonema minus]
MLKLFKSKAVVDSEGPGKNSGSTVVSAGAGKSQPREAGGIRLQKPSDAAQVEAVATILHSATAGVSWTLGLWCLGLGTVMLRAARPELAADPITGTFWVAFVPFWLGDIMGMAFQVKLLSDAYPLRFITPEQRVLLERRYGAVGGGALSNTLPQELAGLGIGPLGKSIPCDMAYMPLVQRVAFAALVTVPLLALAIAQQVLACLELSSVAALNAAAPGAVLHRGNMLVTLSPLLAVEAAALVRMLIIRTRGPLPLITAALLLLGTLSIGAKADGVSGVLLSDAPWWAVLIPFWVLIALYLGVVAHIGMGEAFAKRVILSHAQRTSLLLYALALLAAGGGLGMVVARPILQGLPIWELALHVSAPLGALWSAAAMFCLGVCLAMEGAMARLLRTKGFEDPIPLSEVAGHWVKGGPGNENWALLGVVVLNRDNAAKEAQAAAATLGGNRSMSESSFGSSAIGGADDRHRHDSGSYDPLEAIS